MEKLKVYLALKEVWELKEKASEATKGLSFEELQKHYKENAEGIARFFNLKIVPDRNGHFKFKQ